MLIKYSVFGMINYIDFMFNFLPLAYYCWPVSGIFLYVCLVCNTVLAEV